MSKYQEFTFVTFPWMLSADSIDPKSFMTPFHTFTGVYLSPPGLLIVYFVAADNYGWSDIQIDVLLPSRYRPDRYSSSSRTLFRSTSRGHSIPPSSWSILNFSVVLASIILLETIYNWLNPFTDHSVRINRNRPWTVPDYLPWIVLVIIVHILRDILATSSVRLRTFDLEREIEALTYQALDAPNRPVAQSIYIH